MSFRSKILSYLTGPAVSSGRSDLLRISARYRTRLTCSEPSGIVMVGKSSLEISKSLTISCLHSTFFSKASSAVPFPLSDW